MKRVVSKSILLGVVLLAILFCFPLDSQALAVENTHKQITAAFPDFSDLSQFTLNRSTLTSNPNGTGALANGHHVLRLVPARGYQSGSAFLTKRVSLANERSFSTYFSFQMTDQGATGADGIVFAVQTLANNVGSVGSGIGYSGITPSVGVEFDNWYNAGTDPNDNHVGLDVNGKIASIATAEPPGQLDSGHIWHSWIDYDGRSKLLEVRMGIDSTRPKQPILSKAIDLKQILNMDEVYVVFTSATGSAWANHDIHSFYFSNDFGPIDLSSNTYTQAATLVTAIASPPATYDQSTISAVVFDANNKPIPGQTVTFTTTLGTINDTAVTDENGEATATLSKTADTIAGTATVKAIAPGGAYGQVDVEFLGTPNVAPSFTKGPDQMVNKQQVTSHTVTGWATGISAGTDDESQQQLHFVVTNSDNGLFVDQPAISPDGTLSYTPAPGANGRATVSVRLQDDGGTAQGGQDTSPEQTFEIVIDTLEPAIGNITQNVTDWTNQPVLVHAEFDGTGTAIVSKKFAYGEQTTSYFAGNGSDLTDNNFVANASGVYTIYARDAAGNETVTTYYVQNIDTAPPVTTVEMPPHFRSNEWHSSELAFRGFAFWRIENADSHQWRRVVRRNRSRIHLLRRWQLRGRFSQHRPSRKCRNRPNNCFYSVQNGTPIENHR